MSRRRKQVLAEQLRMRQLLSEPLTIETTTSSSETASPEPVPTPEPTTSSKNESQSPLPECSSSDSDIQPYEGSDVEFWRRRWRECAGDDACLFTLHPAMTYKQWWQKYWFDCLCEALGDDFGGDHCELGSGRATTSMYLLQHTPCVTLVDQCQEAFPIVLHNCEKHKLPVPTMLVADVRATGLRADYYKSVYSIGLLEHLEDPTPVITETYRILKPGGILFHVVIETPGDGERYPKGMKWYTEALESAGFKDAQAIQELQEGKFIILAHK